MSVQVSKVSMITCKYCKMRGITCDGEKKTKGVGTVGGEVSSRQVGKEGGREVGCEGWVPSSIRRV